MAAAGGCRRWMVGARQMWFLEQECAAAAAAGLGQSRQPTGGGRGVGEESCRLSRNLCNQLSTPRLLLCLPALQFQPPPYCTFVSGTQTLLCGFHSLIFSVAFIKLLTTWTQMNERMGMICIRSLLSQTVSFVRNNGLCLFAAGRILRPCLSKGMKVDENG